MLRLPSDRLIPKMVVGRPIIGENGRVLLTAGQILNAKYIRRIQELKIPEVYIDDLLGIEDVAPLVRSETVSRATLALKRSFQQCIKSGKADLNPIKSEIDNIIDEIATNTNLSIGMAELKTHDDYTYQHSVNVCVLAIIMGSSIGYNRRQLQELGAGAIMHDIGKVNIPLGILNKSGALNNEELNIIKKHPSDGFKMIRNSPQIKSVSARVTLQHHERFDGMGYPRRVAREAIHEYGLIVAVADVFDALISNRSYRSAYNNQEAINIVKQGKGSQFSPQFVDVLSRHINPCPCGTVVALNTGDIAIVCQENFKDFKKPQVKLLFDWQNQTYNKEYCLNLANVDSIQISDIYGTTEATKVICRYLAPDSATSQAKGQKMAEVFSKLI